LMRLLLLQHLDPATQENKRLADLTSYRAFRKMELSDESDEANSQIQHVKFPDLRVDTSRKRTIRAYSGREEIGMIIEQVCIRLFPIGHRKWRVVGPSQRSLQCFADLPGRPVTSESG
jgi:hypothetical protein